MAHAWADLGRRLSSELVALTPPYTSRMPVRSVDDGSGLPLGSLILGTGDTTIAVLAELTAVCSRAPWAIPCLALPSGQEPLGLPLMLVTELRDRLVLVNASRGRRVDELAHVLGCARRRTPPTPTVLARWVARRLQRRELEAPLRSQFAEALDGTPARVEISVASYSRLFSQYGEYTARDWRALAHLCVLAQTGAVVGDHTQARLPLRTALAYVKRYLCIQYHVLTERVGWEWVLEGALRSARYI